MKNLSDIIYKTGIIEVIGHTDMMIAGVASDSRQIKPGFLFIAQSGLNTDGHQYIPKAIEAGAVAVICEQIPSDIPENITMVRVKSSASSPGIIASNFYDNPDRKIQLVGVTGTNGKTSTVSLLYELFTQLGHPCGMLSTIKNIVAGKELETTHTTPDAVRLHQLLFEMVEAGCTYAFMEVSSHAVAQQRIAGVTFSGGVFTNITHDHLDYHSSFSAYLQAKKAFFDALDKQAFALTNLDDKNGMVMLQNTRAAKKTYGMKTMADFHARLLENNMAGTHLMIDGREVWSRLVGRFNAYNLLAAYGTARLLHLDPDEVLTALSRCTPPPGRFEHLSGKENISVIIDYAHTPDALENVLLTIEEVRTGQETLITVVGCGGNRDTSKRPIMAAIAAMNSDKVILTSDNPRYEDPEKIIEEMKTGLDPVAKQKTFAITNRKEAIHAACKMAKPGDIVLVAGKGHEKYQEVNGVRYPFDDKQVAAEALQN